MPSAIAPLKLCCSHGFWVLFTVGALLHQRAMAQVIPDGTLGPESSQVLINGVTVDGAAADLIRQGARRGENVFHSFASFSIGEGQRVYFDNPAGVARIFSRVTGGDPSNILGTLGALGTADLFFLNPNGVLFGPNARLDVGGSFLASTADAFEFAEAGSFSARLPETPSPLLTIQPKAFLFGQSPGPMPPGTIVVQPPAAPRVRDDVVLEVPNGERLVLLGEDIVINGRQLNALGGRIELGSIAGAGTVGLEPDGRLTFPTDVVRGSVTLENGAIATVRLAGGGDIGVTAQSIHLLESELQAGIAENLGNVGSQAGDIVLNATSWVRVSGDSKRVSNSVASGATGSAGNIVVSAPILEILGGAGLVSDGFGNGEAGDIIINASESVLIAGEDSVGFGGDISSSVVPDAIGNAGTIEINTRTLNLLDGGQIASAMLGQGNAGDVQIDASDSVRLVGRSRLGFPSGIFSVIGSGTSGDGGAIRINTQVLEVLNGAELLSGAASTSSNPDEFIEGRGERGDAGDLIINASERVRLAGRSEPVQLLGEGEAIAFRSFAGADTAPDSTSDGGTIVITTPIFEMFDGARLISGTQGSGDAGDIRLTVSDRIALDDNAEILADSIGTGRGGNINITARTLSLTNQSIIATQTLSNDGGNITLTLGELLALFDNSLISTEAGTAEAGGNGGDITITTLFLVADPDENSDIVADAFDGDGGNVNITATGGIFGIVPRPFRTPQSDITASSRNGVSGVITVQTPDVDPSQATLDLPTTFAAPEIARSCREYAQTGSSFVVTGRGGIPQGPLDLPTTVLWQDVLPIEGDLPSDSETLSNPAPETSLASQDPMVEAQGLMREANGQITLLAATAPPTVVGQTVECQEP